MALIKCPECSAEISDKATACPKCGNPMAPPERRSEYTEAPAPQAQGKTGGGGWFKWLLIIPSVLFGMVMCIGSVADPDGKGATARLESQKNECAAAMMSSMGHSTVGYADKAAYDAKVREACDGLTIDGKPLGR